MNDTQLTAYAATLLRISLGTLALAHGLLKIFVFTPAGTVGFFASLGLPAALAYATIGIEVVGGIALIAGVKTRYVSLAMIPILLGATVVHSSAGWVFSNQGGGWEFPAFWAVALAVQAMLGDGALALRLPARKQRLARTAA
ncbi:MAG: DoxX family protein [Gammaproteobacteria bacterium]|nr:DoxX family protein [Gammaproteobacteria bacterium]MBT8104794.1 DoxX family protein [Gammaproteobacteria bacterium]NNF50086.1 DoxX family protein [Woeseiaceae bacterium]NNK24808.1 DoxX family protein [Woeseiaceae bacterium]